MDDVEIEIVVPQSIDALGRVDQRNALFLTEPSRHSVVGGVGGDDVVDRLEDGAVEILDLAWAILVDRHARGAEDHLHAVITRERDQLAIASPLPAFHPPLLRKPPPPP